MSCREGWCLGSRDETELAGLCARELPRLIGLLVLQVGDRAVAEELAQDVLVALCERWPDIERPEAWLTGVAFNMSNSWWRRRLAERRAMRRHGPTATVTEDPQPRDVTAVRRAVAGLPKRQREAVILRFHEELSVTETARMMGCAEGTVRALTHRGLTAVRRQTGLITSEEVVSDAYS